MPGRIRTIKPELLEDAKTSGLDDHSWRMFVSLLLLADDYGNCRADVRYLDGQAFHSASGKFARTSRESREHLVKVGLVALYSVAGQDYLHVRGWDKHQRVDHPGKPRCPSFSEALAKVPESLAKVPESLATDPDPDPDRYPDPDHRIDTPSGVLPTAPQGQGPQEPEADAVAAAATSRKADARDAYLRERCASIVRVASEVTGMTPTIATGKLRKLAGHLIQVAKGDGYKSTAANATEVDRLVREYCRDPEPFVTKHPLGMLLTERLDRYRRPLTPTAAPAGGTP